MNSLKGFMQGYETVLVVEGGGWVFTCLWGGGQLFHYVVKSCRLVISNKYQKESWGGVPLQNS